MPLRHQSHGRIGEAAVFAKCWMHGIPAYSTGGLRANFAGSDLIVETGDPRHKLWVQVKTGAPTGAKLIYLTQCAGENDLSQDKFAADFVIFVNIDKERAGHLHDGSLDFTHLSYYVLPRDDANRIYLVSVRREFARPKKNGGVRSLVNMAVEAAPEEMIPFKDGWQRLRQVAKITG